MNAPGEIRYRENNASLCSVGSGEADAGGFCSIVLSLNHCRLLNRLGSLKQNLSQVSLLALWDILSHLRRAQQPEMSEKRSSIWFVILQCATDLMPENIHFYAAAPTV